MRIFHIFFPLYSGTSYTQCSPLFVYSAPETGFAVDRNAPSEPGRTLKMSTQHSGQCYQIRAGTWADLFSVSVLPRRLPSWQVHTAPLHPTSPKWKSSAFLNKPAPPTSFPCISTWQLHPSSCLGQNPWCHSWLLSFNSHIHPSADHGRLYFQNIFKIQPSFLLPPWSKFSSSLSWLVSHIQSITHFWLVLCPKYISSPCLFSISASPTLV